MQILSKPLFDGSSTRSLPEGQAARGLANLQSAAVATPRDLAAQKLEGAKEEIDYLKRWGFPPDIIAQRAGELLRTVSAAANDFAQAAGTTASDASVASPSVDVASPSGGGPATDKADSESDQETGAQDMAPSGTVVRMPQGYQAIMNDGLSAAAMGATDQASLAEFQAVMDELRRLQRSSKGGGNSSLG